MAKKDEPQLNISEQLQPLVDDDAFLTSLSQGQDPSAGEDELAGLLLELRDDVEKQMPPAPVIEGADEEAEVISLAAASKRRRSRPFVNGLIGAAAATLVIAGTGTAVYNAGPGSPLYDVHKSMFGSSDASSVELAGTLEEMDRRSANGDMAGTRELLNEARRIIDESRNSQPEPTSAEKPSATPATKPFSVARSTVTATETLEKEVPASSPEPAPVTVTEYQTITSTVVVPDTPSQETGEQTEPTSVATDNSGVQGADGYLGENQQQ